MFYRRAVLALTLPPLLGGCLALVHDAEAIAYRPGTTPTTTVAKCDATFSLSASQADERAELPVIELPKGATVGYRRETDGSLVAVAGERAIPILNDNAVWRYTPIPAARWKEFADATGRRCQAVAGVLIGVPLFPLVLVWLLTGHEVP